jgi:hypothetical protein
VLLLHDSDVRLAGAISTCEAVALRGAPIAIGVRAFRGRTALGAIGDTDALDAPADPAIDADALGDALRAAGAGDRELARAIADREGVIDASALAGIAPAAWPRHARPMTLFERAALADVLGEELASLLPVDRVAIDRAPLAGAALNHCAMQGGIAVIRLLATNGTTLAGRTHALVHELGHALIGVARHLGRSYACEYGQPDYARFFPPRTHASLCHEEALVRAIADAWLLRRAGVTWSRTWPGAVDDVARDLDADDLAAFARFRLAQGLGLAHAPIAPRRVFP